MSPRADGGEIVMAGKRSFVLYLFDRITGVSTGDDATRSRIFNVRVTNIARFYSDGGSSNFTIARKINDEICFCFFLSRGSRNKNAIFELSL